MAYKIICRDLTGEDCGFVAEGETREETKNCFYEHGEKSPLHQERYHSATDEEKAAFSQTLGEHLARQGQ